MRVVGNISQFKKPPKIPTLDEILSKVPTVEDILAKIPSPKDGLNGLQGPRGPKGDKGDSISLDDTLPLIEALVKSEIDKIEVEPDHITYKIVGGAGLPPVAYITTITTSEYRINKNELKAGTNIFGVNYAGDVDVYLPAPHEELKSRIIVVKDESGSASSYNITIHSE